MTRSEDECDQLVTDATEMFEKFPVDSAEVFEDAGRCYDERGERARAAQYYTLAGDMYFRSNHDKKAEKCYARAIIRNLMADELEASKVVLQRGSDLGFETSMFRMAAKSVQKRLEEDKAVVEPVPMPTDIEITATPLSISETELSISELQREEVQVDLEHHVLESVEEFEVSGVGEEGITESSSDQIMAAMAQKRRSVIEDHMVGSLPTTFSEEDDRTLQVTSTLIPTRAADRIVSVEEPELPKSFSITEIPIHPSKTQVPSGLMGLDTLETIPLPTSSYHPSEVTTPELRSLDITVPESKDTIDLVVPTHLDSIKMRIPENIDKVDLVIPSDQRIKLLPQEGQDFIDLAVPDTLTQFTLILDKDKDTLTIPIPKKIGYVDILLPETAETIEVLNEATDEYEIVRAEIPRSPVRLTPSEDKDFITVRLPEALTKLNVLVPEEVDSLRFKVSPERTPILLEVPKEVERLGMSVSPEQRYLDIAVPKETNIVPVAVPENLKSLDILVPQEIHIGLIQSETIQEKTIQKLDVMVSPSSTIIDLPPLPGKEEVEILVPKETKTLSVLAPEGSSQVDLLVPTDSVSLDVVVPKGVEKLKVVNIETGSIEEVKISPDQKTVALSAPEGQQKIRIELPTGIQKLDVVVEDRPTLILPVSGSSSAVRIELPDGVDKISTFLSTEVSKIDLTPSPIDGSIESITPIYEELEEVTSVIKSEIPALDQLTSLLSIPDSLSELSATLLQEKPLTSSLEYLSVSEVKNPYEDTVENVETTDVIPLAWQVVGFELEGGTLSARKLEKGKGVTYTWKWDKLEAGQTKKVQYSLRKRLHRTIVQAKGKRIQTQSSYHSIGQESEGAWQVTIDYKNPFEGTAPFVLIEDEIPPEVLIQAYSAGDFRPIILPSKESTIFRWILRNFSPVDAFEVTYEFTDKPITMRHIRNILDEDENVLLYFERIVQPVEDAFGMAYYYFNKLRANKNLEISLEEPIPLDYEHKGTDPTWLEPTIYEQDDMKIFQWKHSLKKGETRQFVTLVRGSIAFALGMPYLKIEGLTCKGQQIERYNERKKLDLRKLLAEE